MLELKNIKKSYNTGSFSQQALKGINLQFRKSEFVAILGASGSGKTTLLNIIGGLDRYDSGDLIINNKSTKKFKDNDWDSYRNNCIGFVFQSYNLIGHISVLENVEMGMTLSGISVKKRRKKALEVLDKVGLSSHVYKRPNQLSGGQMQRVAIARALANDPDIILADEPTGALDSTTSVQIMELIKEISKDKLVIMVTHNAELASDYASRIINLKDGKLISDSNPIKNNKNDAKFKIKKTAMSYMTALKLSFNNILNKKGRTLLTAFASSIGIIGIALILSLSNGFDIQIKKFERDTLSVMPIMISEQSMNMDEETIKSLQKDMYETSNDFPDNLEVYPKSSVMTEMTYKNVITKDFVDYIEKIDNNLIGGVSYTRSLGINVITDKYTTFQFTYLNSLAYPRKFNNDNTVIEETYDLLYGKLPENKNELVLVINSKNNLDKDLLNSLGFDGEKDSISFEEIVNKEFKLVLNDDYYKELGSYFTLNTDFKSLYDGGETLKIVGILRGKEDKKIVAANSSGIMYTEELVKYIIEKNKESKIVKLQESADYNVLTGEKFTDDETGMETKKNLLGYLGGSEIPVAINIFPKDFDSKDEITTYLDEYNKNHDQKIVYTDMGAMISSLSGNVMDAITVVLIAFSAISLIVSSIMIGIITYISVLERTKEIGVLRALGARKKDITRVFNAETFIIGVTSGLIGLIIARLLIFPANSIIYDLTSLNNVAKMNPIHALLLLCVSMALTVIGGAIPAIMASKKDPVIALRTE